VGEPEPVYDPEDKPKPDAPRPDARRADWVVGAEEGLSAEIQRAESGQMPSPVKPRLSRPEGSDPRPEAVDPTKQRPMSGLIATGTFPKRAPAPVTPTARDPMPTWERGASSVPTMRRASEGAAASAPAPEREFPMDDAEERARVAAELALQKQQEAAVAARPHEVVAPQEFEMPALPAQWWSSIPNLARLDPRLAVVLGLLVLAAGVYTFWPRHEKTISVAHLKEYPERYADTEVRVGGRVSEVFAVGGSWAYTLVQGRDTIVVFSRTRAPRVRDHIVVVGTLSTGFLDGQSRAAIFEATR